MRKTSKLLAVCFLTYTANCQAVVPEIFSFPFYAGIGAGYGTTTWRGLVPRRNLQNRAMTMSVPYQVSEGGLTGNIFVGFDVVPEFALEFGFTQYPNAKVSFDPESIFTFNHGWATEIITRTQVYSWVGKIQMIVADTGVRAFSGLGIGLMHRSDHVNDHYRVTPSFVFGVSYNVNPHFMIDATGNFTAGFGASEFCPTDDYMPFVYSLMGRLAYRF